MKLNVMEGFETNNTEMLLELLIEISKSLKKKSIDFALNKIIILDLIDIKFSLFGKTSTFEI